MGHIVHSVKPTIAVWIMRRIMARRVENSIQISLRNESHLNELFGQILSVYPGVCTSTCLNTKLFLQWDRGCGLCHLLISCIVLNIRQQLTL